MKLKNLSEVGFAKGINVLVSEYGSKQFQQHKLERIYATVFDLPDYAWLEVVGQIVDAYKTAPSTNEIHKEAQAWHKHFFNKNGFWYGQNAASEGPYVPTCRECDDLGFVQVEIEDFNFSSVARCSCEIGSQLQEKTIPQWQPKFSQYMKKSKCPVDWFKPDNEKLVDKQGKFTYLALKKMDEWKAKKQFATEFWPSFREQMNLN